MIYVQIAFRDTFILMITGTFVGKWKLVIFINLDID